MPQASTLKFLRDLKKNNNKPWFEKNRSAYQDAKEDVERFAEKVIEGLARIDPAIAALQPKDCTFRIYRDVRFSRDKSPYKTNMGAYLNKGGKRSPTAGYYVHFEPGRCFAAGGLWMPMPADLARVRQEIDYNFSEWQDILRSRAFKKYFPEGMSQEDILSRPPKGYSDENPAIQYLKLKSFIVTRKFADAEVLSPSFLKQLLRTYEPVKELVYFLNRSIE
ncbi:MAG TPA: DUF2461 domain-containing protein [Puia sp.]|nr:DUF2461 domain-containing protein [Puia sp.]